MKILYVINNLGSGGAEKLIEQTLPLLNNRENVQVDLLLMSKKNNIYADTLKENGINIYYSSFNSLKNPLHVFEILKLIKQMNYDIVHAHLFPTLYWVSLARKILRNNKLKVVLTEHNTHNRRREIKFLKIIEKWIYSSFDKIISISHGTQNNLMKWLNIYNNNIKFKIIHNGVDIEYFKNAKPYKKSELVPELDKSNFLLCMVGRFSKQKDQLTVIKTLELLPENTHLLLVGEGEQIDEHKNFARMLNLNNRVHFLGFRKDINRILKTCDVNVVSSNWEGFGLVAVEGMAAGKPVVGTSVEGLRNVIEQSELIFDIGDYIKLSEIIKKLHLEKDYYQQKVENSVKIAEKYKVEFMIDKLVAEYRE